MTHRVIAQRLRGEGAGEFIDFDIPMSDVAVTDSLSAPCQVTGTVPMAFQHLQAWDGLPVYSEWDTRLLVEEDGEFLGQGILVRTGIDNEKLSLDCAGFSYYAKGQPYEGDYSATGVDPADAFREIWEHLQSRPYGDMGVVVDSTTTGRKIGVEGDGTGGEYTDGPYRLNWWETHDLGAKQDELAKLGPFDYHEKSRWLIPDETIEDRIEIGYPRIGRRRHDLSFAVGTNIFTPPSLSRDGENFATGLLVLGAGEGREMVRALVDSGMTGRLRRIAVLSDRNLTSVSTASARGREELARRLILNDFTTVSVTDYIGRWNVGDEVPVQVVTDWIDTTVWVRILSSTRTPGNLETATLTVERVERFA